MPEMDRDPPIQVPLTAEQKAVIHAAVHEWRILGAVLGLMFAVLAIMTLNHADWQSMSGTQIFWIIAGGMVGGGVLGSLFGFVAGSLKAQPSKKTQAPTRHPLDPDPE